MRATTEGPPSVLKDMFQFMVVAKDATQISTYYDPHFQMQSNGVVQDYAAFAADHKRLYPTGITYQVEYHDDTWVETEDRLAGRLWITTQRPGEESHRIEVVLIATFRNARIHRLWELTWPDSSRLPTFQTYGQE